MAKVQVVFGDEQGVYFSAENENLIQSFLEKYKSDLGEDFVKDFYNKYDDDIWLLECLVELEITTSSQEEKHKSILKLL